MSGISGEGQGDLVSRLITPITHLVTLLIPILNLFTKSPGDALGKGHTQRAWAHNDSDTWASAINIESHALKAYGPP